MDILDLLHRELYLADELSLCYAGQSPPETPLPLPPLLLIGPHEAPALARLF